MGERKDGGQAFPSEFFETEHGDRVEAFAGSPGMTLRDWFAGQALMLAQADYAKGIPEYDLRAMFGGRMGLRKEEIIAALAGRYADAMLAERSKP